MQLLKNKAQEEAINTISGPVLLISCPGSGKTTTLVRRIHHLVEVGIRPDSILMVTFTRDAATGMAEKYRNMFDSNPGVTFATIHSLCFNILKLEGRVSNDSVLQEERKLVYLSNFLRSKGFFKDAWEMSISAATAISSCKNNYLAPEEIDVPGLSSELFTSVYDVYESWKERESLIDFDDMLLFCLDMLKNEPDVLAKYQKRFQYIQCDEYQDTNYIQRDILYLLSQDNHNLCVVGDDDQSIYMFRGARPEIMLNFAKDFPKAKIIHMDTNYRSGKLVIDAAGHLIGHNQARFSKKLASQRGDDGVDGNILVRKYQSRKDEMGDVLNRICEAHHNGIPYHEMAILFRTNEQAQNPVVTLSDAGIPYYSTENVKSMYESFIFEDIKNYVSLSTGTGGTKELMSVLNHPNRYFREANFKSCTYTTESLMEAAMNNAGHAEQWKIEKAQDAVLDWMHAFGPGRVSLDDAPGTLFTKLQSFSYTKYLKEYADFRNMELDEVVSIYDDLKADAAKYEAIYDWFFAADAYVTKLKEEMRKKDRDGVILTTMHKAKGLEWRLVFIIDSDEMIIPHKKSQRPDEIEEERRLFYVAMTRAKDELVIGTVGTPSRFISEFKENKKVNYAVSPSDIPKKLAGARVTHKTFGDGFVVRYEPGKIIIRFPEQKEKIKVFQFPETFSRGIMDYK